MGIVVDSSIFIAVERGRLDLAPFLRDYADERIVVSAITASELLHGVHRANTPGRRLEREKSVERILAERSVIAFDLPIARVHAELGARLTAGGIVIGNHDQMIAATALWLGFEVATRDERSFPLVPGLQILRW